MASEGCWKSLYNVLFKSAKLEGSTCMSIWYNQRESPIAHSLACATQTCHKFKDFIKLSTISCLTINVGKHYIYTLLALHIYLLLYRQIYRILGYNKMLNIGLPTNMVSQLPYYCQNFRLRSNLNQICKCAWKGSHFVTEQPTSREGKVQRWKSPARHWLQEHPSLTPHDSSKPSAAQPRTPCWRAETSCSAAPGRCQSSRALANSKTDKAEG